MAALSEQLITADKMFRKYFKVSFQQFEDRLLSVVFGRPTIDICKFDNYLNTPDGVSMEEMLVKKYGQEATDWFKETFLFL